MGSHFKNTFYRRRGKRLFDIALSLPTVIIFSPLLLAIAAAVRIFIGRPILFKQERPGINSRPFTICKFRTMADKRDEAGEPLPDSLRLTRFGRFLRSTSLDELPELINVLTGEMSLVGPRPLLMEYLPLYSARQARRHDVRPGITGWAQVNGRNALSWEEKFKLDVWYAGNVSFWLDVKILFMTVIKVLKREDINMQGRATMEKFKGTRITHGR